MSFRLTIILTLIFIPFSILGAQETNSDLLKEGVLIQSLSSPVIFDGVPDEDAWNSIPTFRMTMHSPVFGKEPTEKTDIRIAYDDKYLFVGAVCYYSDISLIRSASYKRDYLGMGGDWLDIALDTYNDKENSVAFFVSPDALRLDVTIQKDAVTTFNDDMPMNISWNTFWDVLTKHTSEGWSCEIRIPLSSIMFQEINGEVRMGLIIERWIAARNEIDLYPAIPPNWGPTSAMKPSQAQEIIFRGLKPGKPVYITPYALAGYEAGNRLTQAGSSYERTSKPVFNAGLDVKYGLSSNMVLDLTLNTDFAQVEADDQQFNMTRYDLFFPEKRLFFLERSSNFDFSLGAYNNIFYSRRIGLSDDGDPIRIYGGARVTGRLGKWDLGVLDMQTAPLWLKNADGQREEILPSENFGVLRLRRQVINDNSYFGTIFASRLGMNGNYNIAVGLDAIVRLFGEDYLDIRWGGTAENDTINSSFKEPMRLSANWERRSKKGLGYNIGYSYSGIHFNPGMGFEMNNDYSNIRAGLRYGWLPGENSKIYSISPDYMLRYSRYAIDGSLMTLSNTLGWTLLTKNQMQASVRFMKSTENLKDSLVLIKDEVYIPPGRYGFMNIEATITTPASKPLYAILKTETGQFYDGKRFSVSAVPTWNISKHFELGGTYSIDYVNFDARNISFTNHIIGLKAMYMLDTRFSVNAFIQYNTSVNEVYSNVRLRYNPKEGNDFYLVLNEGRNTNLNREAPRLPVYNTRAIMVKYSYTFNL